MATKWLAIWLFGSLLLACAMPAQANDNGRGLHKKIYAVPATGPVAMDGSLKDWDQSAQIEMYVFKQTEPVQNAKFAIMYDDQALYLSGVVRDPHPMMNRHDPQVEPDRGWDGCSCQFRMELDPSHGYPIIKSEWDKDADDYQLVNMTLWWYTDKQQPVLQLIYGMGKNRSPGKYKAGVVPNDLYQAVYRKADDGAGYTLEYRIPWSTLDAPHPPKANDIVAGTVQFNWGAASGMSGSGASGWSYDVMSKPGFPYGSSGCWGKIDFAPNGHLPSGLVEPASTPEKQLPLAFSYTMPSDGEVSYQLFDATGMCVRTLLASAPRTAGRHTEQWDGLDDTGKPLQSGTYTWKGLYHQPLKTKFIMSVHNSGQPPYKTDDGTGGWGADHGMPTSTACAGDRMILTWSICETGWGIICTDLNGKKIWGSHHNAEDVATDGKRIFVVGDAWYQDSNRVKVFDLNGGLPLSFGNGKPALDPPAGGDDPSNVATAVAYASGKIYASYHNRDAVCIYDATSGDLVDTWTVKQPGRLAVRADGSLLAVSGGEIVTVDKNSAQPFLTDHLDSPKSIAVAPDGAVYVANSGSLQNVSVFSSAGKYVRSIGVSGGRPRVGDYNRNGMLEPGGISLDTNGRLWVAETLDYPKRISVWDAATGKLVSEFFGGSNYYGFAYMDPHHPDEIYCHNTIWKVDLNKGTWSPVSTIWRPTAPNMIEAPNPNGYAGHFRVMTAKYGKQFGWGQVDYCNVLYMRVGNIFKPIAGSMRVAHKQSFGGEPLYPVMDDSGKYPNGFYLWQDKNDDQTVQDDEIVSSPWRNGSAFNWIDADLNVWCDSGYMFKPVSFGKDGRPVYDFSQPIKIPFVGINSNSTSLWLDNKDDTVYTLAPGKEPGLARWSRDGKLIWGYEGVMPWQYSLNMPIVTPGHLHGLDSPMLVAGDFTGAQTYFGPRHIFTRDGLYVGMVMRDVRTTGLGPDVTATEVDGGELVKPDGMSRYFLIGGDQDGRVTEVLGLDTVKRLRGGAFTVSNDDAQAAITAQADYQRSLAASQQLEIVRGPASLEDADEVGKSVDSTRSFTAKAAYDTKNLYVSYDVTSPSDLVNGFNDMQRIFKGGNCLDIQIATDTKADPERKTPAPGDIRILVTRQNNQPVAVVFRPKVLGFNGEPIVLTSPTGKESFDAIDPAPQVGLIYTKTATGFQALVTIPLAYLGMTLQPWQKVRMDIGYVFGNSTGTQAAARAYWMNSGFSAGVTNDVPNESRLEPSQWGTASVE